jgi:hypothetical protein
MVIMRTSWNLDQNVRIKVSDKIIKDGAKFIYSGSGINSEGKALVFGNSSEPDVIWLSSAHLSKLVNTWRLQFIGVGRDLATFRSLIQISQHLASSIHRSRT